MFIAFQTSLFFPFTHPVGTVSFVSRFITGKKNTVINSLTAVLSSCPFNEIPIGTFTEIKYEKL